MIRVLRVLEYEYDDHAHYERDSANWTTTLPVGGHGAIQRWAGPRMTSEVVRVQEIPTTTPLPPPPRCTSIATLIGQTISGHGVITPGDSNGPQCVLPQGHEGWHSDGTHPFPMQWTEHQP